MAMEAVGSTQRQALDSLAQRICQHIQHEWMVDDISVFYRLHADKYIDITVISPLFEGQMGPEREAKLWQLLAPFSKQELLYLTGCLLLTPQEAQQLAVERPASQ